MEFLPIIVAFVFAGLIVIGLLILFIVFEIEEHKKKKDKKKGD